jgi:hypothetical protein
MTPQEQAIASAIDSAFEKLAQTLDQIAQKHDLDSVVMMWLVNGWADFPKYYADWIQETWETVARTGGDV